MTELVHLSFEEIRAAAHDLAENRRTARRDYERHATKVVEAERAFRQKRGRELAKFRAADKGFGESEILADAEAAGERAERDMEQVLAKVALLRIEELESDRAMLRQLGEWSKDLEVVG
jgi:hypothetical protein